MMCHGVMLHCESGCVCACETVCKLKKIIREYCLYTITSDAHDVSKSNDYLLDSYRVVEHSSVTKN